LTGTGTDTTTGASDRYGFHTDMRFMAGNFIGTDGRVHRGTFAFIGLGSVLVPNPTASGASPLDPHLYSPGVSGSDVVWTTEIPEASVEFDLREEEASLHLKNVFVFDAFTVPNALNTFHPMGKVRAPGDLFSRAIWCLRTSPDGSAGPAPCTPGGAWARASSWLAWGDGCPNATGDRLGPRRGRTAGDRRRPPVFPRPTTTCGGLER
jgi:hypothetical protein